MRKYIFILIGLLVIASTDIEAYMRRGRRRRRGKKRKVSSELLYSYRGEKDYASFGAGLQYYETEGLVIQGIYNINKKTSILAGFSLPMLLNKGSMDDIVDTAKLFVEYVTHTDTIILGVVETKVSFNLYNFPLLCRYKFWKIFHLSSGLLPSICQAKASTKRGENQSAEDIEWGDYGVILGGGRVTLDYSSPATKNPYEVDIAINKFSLGIPLIIGLETGSKKGFFFNFELGVAFYLGGTTTKTQKIEDTEAVLKLELETVCPWVNLGVGWYF
jgi:hypothetical protein